MNKQKCNICGSSKSEVLIDRGDYKFVKCKDCDLIYTFPQPSSKTLDKLYCKGYFRRAAAVGKSFRDYTVGVDEYLKVFRRRAKIISKYKKTGDILDVGCAIGCFLEVMKDRGWHVSGVDLSKDAVDYCKQRFGVEAFNGPLQDAGFKEKQFDVITLWGILEHMRDPNAELEYMRTLLKDDGILFVETPDIESFMFQLLESKWPHMKPEHLYHFSNKTLGQLLNSKGFDVLRVTRQHTGKYVDIDYLLHRVKSINPLLYRLLSPLRIISPLSFYINLRDEMLFIAKKKESTT
ncbi:MAG: class I SAM-dependent methyltransferase [archaeon]